MSSQLYFYLSSLLKWYFNLTKPTEEERKKAELPHQDFIQALARAQRPLPLTWKCFFLGLSGQVERPSPIRENQIRNWIKCRNRRNGLEAAIFIKATTNVREIHKGWKMSRAACCIYVLTKCEKDRPRHAALCSRRRWKWHLHFRNPLREQR